MLVLRRKLAGAAAIPKGEPSGSRSLRLRADQSQDSGVGGFKQATGLSLKENLISMIYLIAGKLQIELPI